MLYRLEFEPHPVWRTPKKRDNAREVVIEEKEAA